ncbi:MAG: hypothetical protein WD826_08990, partial [Actinomycetota bacterium]
RHVVHVAEVQGMEGEVITLQDIFRYAFVEGGRGSAKSTGRLRATGLRPRLIDRLKTAGVELPPKFFRDGDRMERSGSIGRGRG